MVAKGEKPVQFENTELQEIIREATRQVEDELALEDQGWIVGGQTSNQIITEMSRIEAVQTSRLYFTKDPLAKQSIRLWTDYTFGTGMTWATEDEKARSALDNYWNSKENQSVLSSRGQRRSSDKLLVEGEVYFALFLGNKQVRVRLIEPLEITEIVTDPDDRDNERYYRREWTDAQNKGHDDYYCSHLNRKNEGCKNASGKVIKATENAKNVLVYHLPYNTIGQRGMPLLLPALDWIKQYRRFLASRVAIMLALARFAWKSKVQGGAAAVASNKTKLDDQEIKAGSVAIENMSSDLQPIRTDSNARNAYDDGRMLRLQLCAAVGIPEQYFGDISSGNLATAKTVELPMMKMFQSYQTIWRDAFKDMDEIVLENAGVDKDVPIDRDFPSIAPEDAVAVATALVAVITALPDLAGIDDVMQVALMSLGITNTAEVLEKIKVEKGKAEMQPKQIVGGIVPPEFGQPSNPALESKVKIIKALQTIREALVKQEKK